MTGMMDLARLEIKEEEKACGYGFFLYDILNRFCKVCIQAGKTEYIEKYEKIKENLKKALNKEAWDGKWFKRAFTDDGKVLGCWENEECKIDSIAQSWSVISRASEDEKTKTAMQSLEEHLVDRNTRYY